MASGPGVLSIPVGLPRLHRERVPRHNDEVGPSAAALGAAELQVLCIPSPEATLRREPGAFDLNDACKSAAKIRGSQSDGDYHRY